MNATTAAAANAILDEARSTPGDYKWLPFRWENRPFSALLFGATGLLLLWFAVWLAYATLTGAPLEFRRAFMSLLNSLPGYWREAALLSFAAVCALIAIQLFDRLFRRSAFYAVGKGGVIARGTFVDSAAAIRKLD